MKRCYMSSFLEQFSTENAPEVLPNLQTVMAVVEKKLDAKDIERYLEFRPVLKKELQSIASFAAAAQHARSRYTEEQLKSFTILPSPADGLELSQFINEFAQMIEEQGHGA
jgi:hypothetical protein